MIRSEGDEDNITIKWEKGGRGGVTVVAVVVRRGRRRHRRQERGRGGLVMSMVAAVELWGTQWRIATAWRWLPQRGMDTTIPVSHK